MEWFELIKQERSQVEKTISSRDQITAGVAEKIYHFVDYTRLQDGDTESDIAFWTQNAATTLGHVAGVCVYPQFLTMIVGQYASTDIKPITVANFPAGNLDLTSVLAEIENALESGAKEIDIVFPYQEYLKGNREMATSFVYACKAACGEQLTLKIILETGALKDFAIIADACSDVIDAGADFVKTSTGKYRDSASQEAAIVLFTIAKEKAAKNKRKIGVKVSGGVRDPFIATQYLALAEQIMGRDSVNQKTFRIGSSHLVDELLKIAEE